MSNSILDRIKEEDIKRWGEICLNPDCGAYKKWCRCHLKKVEHKKESVSKFRSIMNWISRIFK